ncbi:MAG: hypothetical protein VYE65_03915, partial [SAR324 cluster bacterium]|nr:hypothetical protein [SAR324 cluster bacterium]
AVDTPISNVPIPTPQVSRIELPIYSFKTLSLRCCQFSPGGSKIEKAIVKIGTLSIKAIPMILGSHKRLVIFFIVRKCSLENPARSCLQNLSRHYFSGTRSENLLEKAMQRRV